MAAFGKLRRNHFNKWATRPCKSAGKGFTPTYAYNFENERDGVPFMTAGPGEPHNVHAHWYAHIPAARLHDFKGRIWEWLDHIGGNLSAGEAIDIRPIDNLIGMRIYALKGTTKAWAVRFGARHARNQGLVIGRRTGTSLNLGPKERMRLDRERGIRRRAA